MSEPATALIAEDEPLLRRSLVRMLANAWPELEVIAEARNGREAVELVEAHRPEICFLDVHMPGMSGVEAAELIGQRAHLVFVTAYDRYAVAAFERGAVDYLVKPVEPARLAETVRRLQERRTTRPRTSEALLAQLAEALRKTSGAPAPHWLRVSVGRVLRLVRADELDYARSDEKYTLVAWRGDEGAACDGLIRTPLKELLLALDPAHFVQVHRSVVVNLRSISHVTRGANDTAELHLKGRSERLPVSRSYLHLFRQM